MPGVATSAAVRTTEPATDTVVLAAAPATAADVLTAAPATEADALTAVPATDAAVPTALPAAEKTEHACSVSSAQAAAKRPAVRSGEGFVIQTLFVEVSPAAYPRRHRAGASVWPTRWCGRTLTVHKVARQCIFIAMRKSYLYL